jgi:CsoR family transcriptional regulator, copper-sensing transcriptional repressor
LECRVPYPPTVIDDEPFRLYHRIHMMDEQQRKPVVERLKRIEGQVRGLQRMVESDRYCVEILAQTRSVVAALRAVEDLIMENHLQTCVVDAMKSGDPSQQREKVDEVMTVLSQFRKYG